MSASEEEIKQRRR